MVARPRVEAANSFVLHAPLELLARATLLPHVDPREHGTARLRLVELAAGYEAFGPAVGTPPPREPGSAQVAAGNLAAAIDAGDLAEVDALAAWLGRGVDASVLARLLADAVVPRLGAAAHGPIFLYQLPRVAPRGEITGELLRPLARELAREPAWRLTWVDDRPQVGSAPPWVLLDALRRVPRLGVPGSDFIFPVMSQVESTGDAARLLAGPTAAVPLAAGAAVLLRAAAWSMLSEPGEHTPYGWAHCLTLPQAALGVARSCADPSLALAVAATFVAGFRAAFAVQPLEPPELPADPGMPVADALNRCADLAAAAVWHTPVFGLEDVVHQLVTRAAVHRDAHVVKYTLACIDAAAWDRSHARLYLAAAASLHGFWSALGPREPGD